MSSTVIVSDKYEVVLPQAEREALDIRPGQRLTVLRAGGRLELVPAALFADMFGSMPDLPPLDEGERDSPERDG